MSLSSRLPVFDIAEATPEQREVLEEILSGPRGNLDGPFLSWIHNPQLAQHAQRLGAVCRYDSGLPLRLSELAILVTAARWESQAEWHIHYPIALAAGLPADIANAIRAGYIPSFQDPDDMLIYAFASELYESKRVSNAIYARMLERFGLPTTVNLTGLLGYYTLVAMTLNVFDMRAEGQTELPFPENS
jgi:4-carboxymuconolactone decarboxylase